MSANQTVRAWLQHRQDDMHMAVAVAEVVAFVEAKLDMVAEMQTQPLKQYLELVLAVVELLVLVKVLEQQELMALQELLTSTELQEPLAAQQQELMAMQELLISNELLAAEEPLAVEQSLVQLLPLLTLKRGGCHPLAPCLQVVALLQPPPQQLELAHLHSETRMPGRSHEGQHLVQARPPHLMAPPLSTPSCVPVLSAA